MREKLAAALSNVPLRNAKATLRRSETGLQELNLTGGEALNQARFLARIEPKAMADDADISHSLMLRALKSADPTDGDVGFIRLWNAMPDAFWLELGMLILKTRGQRRVRHLFEVEDLRTGETKGAA